MEKVHSLHGNYPVFIPTNATLAATPTATHIATPTPSPIPSPDLDSFLEKIAVAKSKRQQTTRQALRTLVKHHIMPLRQLKVKKLDKFLGALLHPDVGEILAEYEPAIKECYGVYSMMDEELGWEITWEMLEVGVGISDISYEYVLLWGVLDDGLGNH